MLPLLNHPDPQVFCCFSRSVLGRQRQVRQSKRREREREGERERERERYLQGNGRGAVRGPPEGLGIQWEPGGIQGKCFRGHLLLVGP